MSVGLPGSRVPLLSRLALLIAMALLSPALEAQNSGQVSISTGAGLLAALESPDVHSITLEDNVRVEQAAALQYHVPIQLAANRSVTIASGGGKRRTLDFGGVVQLLDLLPSSSLTLVELELTNTAPPSQAYQAGLVTEVQSSPLWPTITGSPTHRVTVQDSEMQTWLPACNPEMQAQKVPTLQQMVKPGGTVSSSGDTIQVVGTFLVGATILYLTPSLRDQVMGTAIYTFQDFNSTCLTDPGAALPPPAPSPGPAPAPASSGLPGWLWPVVGTLLGLAAASLAAGSVILARRRRRRAQQGGAERSSKAEESLVATVVEPGESGEREASSVATTPSTREEALASLSTAIWQTRVGVIEGLEMGELLGKGSFGRVYKGRWRGAIVAVKVLEQTILPGVAFDLSREPLLSVTVAHPSVVSTYRLSVACVHRDAPAGRSGSIGTLEGEKPPQAPPPSVQRSSSGSLKGRQAAGALSSRGVGAAAGGGPGKLGSEASPCAAAAPEQQRHEPSAAGGSADKASSASGRHAENGSPADGLMDIMTSGGLLPPGQYLTQIILEYMDKGSLTDAILAGRFFKPNSRELDLAPIVLTLLDIASGMEYLHSINLVHGDLKGRNVLLKAARCDRRGFVAKISDFGLSRMLGKGETHVETQTFGTVTHAAPELLKHNKLTKAADVYSFAVIMWEMISGEEAFAGMTSVQVIVEVTQGGYRLQAPEPCPPQLSHLLEQCGNPDPQLRPRFEEVVLELRGILREFRRSLDRAPLPSALSSPQHSSALSAEGALLSGALPSL